MQSPIRLLLVEDHLVMRAALRMLLSARPALEVVGETASCDGALQLCARHRPDIILLDIFLADGSSLERIPALIETGARVLVLTGTTDEVLAGRAFTLGAHGVVRKEQPAPVLIEAIRYVHGGGFWRDPVLPSQADAAPANASSEPSALNSLTPREREVIQLIGQGLKNKGLAARLNLSEKTVHNHLASIFRKLGVSDRLELAAFARRHHLLDPLDD